MDAVTAEPLTQAPPRKRRITAIRALEMVVVTLAIATPVATFLFVRNFSHQVFNPGVAASLLLANLLPYVALIVLIGRRIAIHRAAKSALAGGGRLHVRLVAVFTLMASIPIVLTVIAASVMFQSGVQLWGSERARSVFSATQSFGEQGQRVVIERWTGEARTMAADIANEFPTLPLRSQAVQDYLSIQTYRRSLFQFALFRVEDQKKVTALYSYEAPKPEVFAARVSAQVINLLATEESYTGFDTQMIWVVTPVDRARNLFLYVATPNNVDFLNRQYHEADRISAEFDSLQARARSLQFQLNAVLFGVALLIVSIATAIALAVADRLVKPVEQLVTAARRIAAGDLAARVDIPQTGDEISTLGNAFNGMTERLEQQTGALRTANAQLESRRVLIEAVMSGVSAGVISIDAQRNVRLVNESAIELLHQGEQELVGHPLQELAPELDALLDTGDRESVIQLGTGADARTLAVKVTSDEAGQVLTFDDITQQLNDQRRAAWSDVARRIAHEIKNPLTPIQLAAERLKRRYGKKIEPEDSTFAQLTDTIVRQVGDLRRMVDEFSSFARMPKPMFRQESLLDIARQAMFLHEVAHPTLRFEMDAPDPAPGLICDRRQIGQAFTNIVKNAVEAIEARGEGEALPQGEVVMTIRPESEGKIVLTLADNGIGLPVERDRIVEPYMTTRSRGTGLGLAIVKKIVEEHFGTIAFSDRPGGGTLVTICFDTDQLAEMASSPEGERDEEPRPAVLTRTGSGKA